MVDGSPVFEVTCEDGQMDSAMRKYIASDQSDDSTDEVVIGPIGLRTDPSERSPVIAELPAGTILTGFAHTLVGSRWLRVPRSQLPRELELGQAGWVWAQSNANLKCANNVRLDDGSAGDGYCADVGIDIHREPGRSELRRQEQPSRKAIHVVCAVDSSSGQALSLLQDTVLDIGSNDKLNLSVVSLHLSRPKFDEIMGGSSASTLPKTREIAASFDHASSGKEHPRDLFSAAVTAGGVFSVECGVAAGNNADVVATNRILQGADYLLLSCPDPVMRATGFDTNTFLEANPNLTLIRLISSLGRARAFGRQVGNDDLTKKVIATARERLSRALKKTIATSDDDGMSPNKAGCRFLCVSTMDVESNPQLANAFAAIWTSQGRLQVPVGLLPSLAQAFAPDLLTCAKDSYTDLRRALSSRLKANETLSMETILKLFPTAVAL